MDHVLRPTAVLLALLGCTELRPRAERLDGAVPDDAGADAGAVDAGLLDAGETEDAGCPVDPDATCPPLCARPRETIGTLFGDRYLVPGGTTLGCDTLWELAGETYVESGDLIVEEGTRVIAEDRSVLVVERNSRLVVSGSAELPVVFTSESPTRSQSAWAGIAILGSAPLYSPGAEQESGYSIRRVDGVDRDRGRYGGVDPADDCGTIRYLRVEFAGVGRDGSPTAPVFFGGCGRETVVDHLHVYDYGDEDGLLLHGGGFHSEHVIVTRGESDAIAWDFGFRGSMQFVVVHNGVTNDQSAFDGEGDDVERTTTRSEMVVGNATVVGLDARDPAAVDLDRSAFEGFNLLVHGFRYVLDVSEQQRLDVGLESHVVRSTLATVRSVWSNQSSVATSIDPPARNNRHGETGLSSRVLGIDLRRAEWAPEVGSAAGEGGAETVPEGFLQTTYLGAVEPGGDDWTSWTEYPTN